MSGCLCSSLQDRQNLARRCRLVFLGPPAFTETNRIHLVLFGMQNVTFVSYLAANKRIRIQCRLRS
jgi:hypothetical protein